MDGIRYDRNENEMEKKKTEALDALGPSVRRTELPQ